MLNIVGTFASEVLEGGAGNNSIEDRAGGSDTLRGNAGDDRPIVSRLTNMSGSHVRMKGGDGDDYFSLQLLNLHGTTAILDGGAGADLLNLWATGNGATITTGSGADVIQLDNLSPNYNNNLVITDFNTDASGDRLDWDGGSNCYRTLLTFQNTTATSFNTENMGGFPPDGSAIPGQTITGTAGNDTLTGTLGDDVINGLGGDDSIVDSRGGSDRLYGDAGNDFLSIFRTPNMPGSQIRMEGGDGNDRLYLEAYNYNGTTAILDGGAGDDVIVLWSAGNGATVTTGTGSDVIELYGQLLHEGANVVVTDFTTGAGGDRLAWEPALVGYITNWNGGNPFASGHVRLLQSGTDTLLQIDRDGGGNDYSYRTLLTFQNTTATSFNTENMGGFPPDGSAIPGQTITGTAGNDTLTGTLGDDVINGLGGDDSIVDSRGGSDRLYGDAGNDFLSIFRTPNMPGSQIRMEGGDGNDRLYLEAYNYNGTTAILDGGAGDDVIVLWSAGNGATVTTGTGSDVIELYGQLLHEGANVVVTDFTTGAGGDRLAWEPALVGYITNWNGGNPFASGHVRLLQSGTDTLLQIDRDGGGNDYSYRTLLTFQNTTATSFNTENMGGFPPDGSAIPGQTITGTAGNDTLTGTLGDDVINGLGGDDSIVDSRGGSDRLYGDAGNDFLSIFRTPNMPGSQIRMEGGDGNDRLYLEAYNYNGTTAILDGGAGDDVIVLWSAGNGATVTTGTGSDVIELYGQLLHEGANVVVTDFTTGAGGDRLAWEPALVGYITNWNGGNPFTSGHVRLLQSGTDTLLQIDRDGGGNDYSYRTLLTFQNTTATSFNTENMGGFNPHTPGVPGLTITGTDGPDFLTGTSGDDVINGNDGDDTIDGGGGNDFLFGGAGDDTLIGSLGNDRIDGGSGSDTLIVSGNASAYRLLTSGDDFILKGPAGSAYLTSVETIRFGDGTVLELNRMYGPDVNSQAWADGRIPDELLSWETSAEPRSLTFPEADATLVQDGKSGTQPEVMPEWDEPLPFELDTTSVPDPRSGQMLTLGQHGLIVDHYGNNCSWSPSDWLF